MTSEIENIEKGIVVSTIEFDANKRIIGIGTPTITPNPTTGIAPLSKQTAFVPEVKENLAQVAEKVLGANPNQAVPIQEPLGNQTVPVIPTPTLNDSITNQAVNVEIPTDLGNLSPIKDATEPIKSTIAEMTKPMAPVIEEPKIEAPEVVVPIAEPIASPQEVMATEPTGINEQLFAGNPVEPMQQAVPIEPVEPIANPSLEQPVPAPLSFEPRAEIKSEEPKQEEVNAVPVTPLNVPISPAPIEQPVTMNTTNTKSSVFVMSDIEKQEMAKKLANIVSSVISSKISEIAYIASYEEFLGLLNEMSKDKNNEMSTNTFETAQTLVNPMAVPQEPEQTMKLAA